MKHLALFLRDFMTASLAFFGNCITEPLSQGEIEALCTAQAQAALALGQLNGTLTWCPQGVHPILTARLIRETLISALQQEGHRFTGARFHAWFSGLVPLCDEPLQFALAPRVLVTSLLAEMTRSTWAPLADAALGLEKACLAVRDTNSKTSVKIVRATLNEAMPVVAALNPAPLPFAPLAALHCAIGHSPRFAPAERATETIALYNIRLVVERPRPPSSRWAIELAFGEHLRASGSLHAALPLNGLIRLDTVRAAEIDENPTQAAIVQADALRACLAHLNHSVDDAARTCRALADRYRAKRVNSRAPQLYSLLNGFGPLRSSQIEAVLGATRLGVRTMLAAFSEAGDLLIETVSGVKLYSVTRHIVPVAPTALVEARCSFSIKALTEYDASLASIDALLGRYDGGSECET